jgi:hypothetical protein
MLLKGVKHVTRLTRNLILLGSLHEEGWLYQAISDKKTLRVIHGSKTVMIGEKSSAHQYKLKGNIVKDEVMNDNANVTVFYPSGDAAIGSASSSHSKRAAEETSQARVYSGSRMDGLRWRAYSPWWSLLYMCQICVQLVVLDLNCIIG